ncbi:MAG: hypothetical protein FWC33_02450 [Candidatus Bathyarchaeota archaeon]|nr:hypothetical protein [Candidatus Termiticorpusculum sp.]
MKLTCLVLISLIVLLFSFCSLSPVVALTGQTVGVKEGDWMEYDVSVEGTGSMPPSHDVRWMRMEILTVDGAAFSANVTVRYANGTIGSAVWQYNFLEGNTEGWTIIPANLGAGDTFFDSYIPGEVLIEREEQRTVLGASRTITGGSDELREVKEWDKTTGFFTYSVEVYKNSTHPEGYYIGDLRVIIHVVATNVWDRQILGLEKNIFAVATSGIVLIVAFSVSAFIWQRKNKREKM